MQRRAFALCLTLIAAVACDLTSRSDLGSVVPTWEGYQARLDALNGRPVNEVIDEWGAPDKVLEAAEGNKLFVWEKSISYTTPDRVSIKQTEDGDGAVGVINRGEEVGISCTTTLRADADGRVASVKAEGAGCVATMPDVTPAPPQAAPQSAATPPAVTPEPVSTPVVDTDRAGEDTEAEAEPSSTKRLDRAKRRRRSKRR